MTQKRTQASRTPALVRIEADFRAARGDRADEEWARTALTRFIFDDVSPESATSALKELVPLLKESDEPAAQLFGPAEDWARDQQNAWRESGIQAYMRDAPMTFPSFMRWTFSLALWLTVLMALATLIADGWATVLRPLMFVLPLGIAVVSVAVRQIWRLAVRKLSRPAAAAVTGIFLMAAGAALGGVAVASKGALGTGATLWLLAPVPLHALLAYMCRRAEKRVQRRPAGVHYRRKTTDALEPPLPDSAWSRALTEQLRLRGDLSADQVRSIVTEAQTFARQADVALHDEFGTPESYAARFRPDQGKKARFEAIGWTAGALLTGVLTGLSIAVEGSILTWTTGLYAVFFVASTTYAAIAWRRSSVSAG